VNPRPQATKIGGLQQLHQLLFSCPLEPIYVAIDFERTGFIINNFSPRSDTQVGISILDTRDLDPPSQKKALKLATYNFVTGSDLYYAESAEKYLWGTSEKISPGSMLKTINKYVRQDRNIVLVGHGFGEDLASLCSLGFDFQASVISILDTANVATELQMNRSTLGRLLGELGCPRSSTRLHNAGNDAHFTLRVLILLAIKGYEEQTLDTSRVKEARVERVEALRAIAMAPLPIVKPKPKKKRIRKKDVAKTWSLKEQEEIREERRQKRMMTAVIETSIS
jgi:DNA polymerase III epsilon subunit-like protein